MNDNLLPPKFLLRYFIGSNKNYDKLKDVFISKYPGKEVLNASVIIVTKLLRKYKPLIKTVSLISSLHTTCGVGNIYDR